MSAAIEVDDVVVRYGEVTALDGTTLHVEAGRVCGLVGMNGSGKTTLLRTITSVVRPDRGQVRVLGELPTRARRRGAIASVPQSEEVDWTFPVSVLDVVRAGRYGRLGTTRRLRAHDHTVVEEALERVGLTDVAEQQVGRLSGGQRKRAFVARGIAQDAEVLLLDEPFAGVDQPTTAMLVTLLRELAAQGRTVLVSTHDLAALDTLCDEAVLLSKRVLLHGTPAEVLEPTALARAFGLDSHRTE